MLHFNRNKTQQFVSSVMVNQLRLSLHQFVKENYSTYTTWAIEKCESQGRRVIPTSHTPPTIEYVCVRQMGVTPTRILAFRIVDLQLERMGIR